MSCEFGRGMNMTECENQEGNTFELIYLAFKAKLKIPLTCAQNSHFNQTRVLSHFEKHPCCQLM